jgi:ABC-type multidrug transport system fused ATPase/permease subunit
MSINRSPIYSYFSETLAGASVIRAFGKENHFMLEMQKRVDDLQQADWADIAITGSSIRYVSWLCNVP